MRCLREVQNRTKTTRQPRHRIAFQGQEINNLEEGITIPEEAYEEEGEAEETEEEEVGVEVEIDTPTQIIKPN